MSDETLAEVRVVRNRRLTTKFATFGCLMVLGAVCAAGGASVCSWLLGLFGGALLAIPSELFNEWPDVERPKSVSSYESDQRLVTNGQDESAGQSA